MQSIIMRQTRWLALFVAPALVAGLAWAGPAQFGKTAAQKPAMCAVGASCCAQGTDAKCCPTDTADTAACCKDGKCDATTCACCKDGKCDAACCKDGKCDAACCKDGKCTAACCKDGKCNACCKDGKCASACCKDGKCDAGCCKDGKCSAACAHCTKVAGAACAKHGRAAAAACPMKAGTPSAQPLRAEWQRSRGPAAAAQAPQHGAACPHGR